MSLNSNQTVVVHGPTPRAAYHRLKKVLAGNIHLALSADERVLVVASEAESSLFSPIDGTQLALSDGRVQAAVRPGDQDMYQHQCAVCNNTSVASAKITHCVSCGSNLGGEGSGKQISLSAVTAAAITENLEDDQMAKKTHAGDELDNFEEIDESDTLESGDEEMDTEDTGEELDEGDGEGEDLNEEVEAEDMGDDESEDDELGEGGEEECSDEELDDDLTDDGEEMDDELEAEDEGDEVIDDGEEDMGDEELDDADTEAKSCKSSDLVVTARSIQSATRIFTNRVIARMSKSKVMAANAQALNMRGILAAVCECGRAVIASDEADHIECANCFNVFEAEDMRHATIKAEDLGETDEDVVDVVDEAESEGDGMDEEEVDAEDYETEDDMSEDELEAAEVDSIDTEDGDMGEAEEDVPDATIETASQRRRRRIKASAKKARVAKATEGEEPEDGEEGENFGEIEELDLSDSEVASTDKLSLAYANDPSAGVAGSAWMLRVNDIPVATLAYADLKGEFKTIAGDSFGRRSFYDTLHSALFADRSQTMVVAKDIGFTGIKIPAVVDAVIASRMKAEKNRVVAAAQSDKDSFIKLFKETAQVAGIGINKGFFHGVNNPVRALLAKSVEKHGLRGGSKLIAMAFDKEGDNMISTLVARTLDLMNKSPQARKEITQAIKQMSGYVQAEDDVAAPAEEDAQPSNEFDDLLEPTTSASSNKVEATDVPSGVDKSNFRARLERTFSRR